MFIACADLHITEKCPLRRNDEDYAQTCLDKLEQVLNHALPAYIEDEDEQPKAMPVIVAGDFFDNLSGVHTPELVNRTMAVLKQYWRVPVYILLGNHDTRFHSRELEMVKKSSYYTLSFLPNIELVYARQAILLPGTKTKLDFFPFGTELEPRGGDVAIIHELAYKTEPFPGAPPKGNWKQIQSRLGDKYKLTIAGDCHIPFIEPGFLNCGSMMRSNVDQVDHKPCYYEIDEDFSIKSIPFEIKEDVWTDNPEILAEVKDEAIEQAVEAMKDEAVVSGLDFEENVRRATESDKLNKNTKQLIMRSLEK